MKQFKTIRDVDTCHFADPKTETIVRDALRALMCAMTTDQSLYDPTKHGWVVLLEPSDPQETWPAFFGCELQEVLWEGAIRTGRCIVAVALRDNECGWTVVVPQLGSFLPPEARARLLAEVQ